MDGYKGFNSDLTCLGFQFEIGKTFKYDGEIELCESGFHFCKTLEDVWLYVDFSDPGYRFCKVKANGKIIEGTHKCVTNEIEILEEIDFQEVLNAGAKSDDYDVRWHVAQAPKTDIKTLKYLAEDEDGGVRLAVAGNPKTDLETLKKLAKDEYWGIRWAVAKNSSTDQETLKILAKDDNCDVRQAAAESQKYRP